MNCVTLAKGIAVLMACTHWTCKSKTSGSLRIHNVLVRGPALPWSAKSGMIHMLDQSPANATRTQPFLGVVQHFFCSSFPLKQPSWLPAKSVNSMCNTSMKLPATALFEPQFGCTLKIDKVGRRGVATAAATRVGLKKNRRGSGQGANGNKDAGWVGEEEENVEKSKNQRKREASTALELAYDLADLSLKNLKQVVRYAILLAIPAACSSFPVTIAASFFWKWQEGGAWGLMLYLSNYIHLDRTH
jgi:hypothetical protein